MTARPRIGLLLLVLLLGACSSAAPPAGPAGAAGDPLRGADLSGVSVAQAAEISDRVATAAEYEAAFRRYRECLTAAGYELRDVQLSDLVYEFGVPGEAVANGADTTCYRVEFRWTDVLWQTSLTGPARQDVTRSA